MRSSTSCTSSSTPTKATTKASTTSDNYSLGKDFVPTLHHVIIGRGKKHSKHNGNVKFSQLVKDEMRAYAAAENKAAKSEVISRLVARVRETGNFVRETRGGWALVEEHAVRTTTAQHFRDALSFQYRSSKEMKKQKRKEDRRSSAAAGASTASSHEDDESIHSSESGSSTSKRSHRCVSPESNDEGNPILKKQRKQHPQQQLLVLANQEQQQPQLLQQQDYLKILAGTFLPQLEDCGENPFEPRPLREASALANHKMIAAKMAPVASAASVAGSNLMAAFADSYDQFNDSATSTASFWNAGLETAAVFWEDMEPMPLVEHRTAAL